MTFDSFLGLVGGSDRIRFGDGEFAVGLIREREAFASLTEAGSSPIFPLSTAEEFSLLESPALLGPEVETELASFGVGVGKEEPAEVDLLTGTGARGNIFLEEVGRLKT